MAKKRSPRNTGQREPGRYVPLATQLLGMIAETELSVNALAQASGVSQPVLSRIVSGARDNVRLDTADKLCEYFGVRLTAPTRKPNK